MAESDSTDQKILLNSDSAAQRQTMVAGVDTIVRIDKLCTTEHSGGQCML